MERKYKTPLIDREIFFGNPKITGAQLSPDGKYISFIKPYKGMMNIWVKKKHDSFDDARPVTADKKRPVRAYFWSRDSKYILYVQDKGGDENWHVYAVDPAAVVKDGDIPEARDLTPYDDIAALILNLPKADHDLLYVALNDRDKSWHDYYAISISTGERVLILKNDYNFNAAYFDLEGRLRLLTKSDDNGGTELFRTDGKHFFKILSVDLEESLMPMRFTREGDFYLITNKGTTNFMSLYLYDLEKEEMEFIESDPDNYVDIEDAIFSELTDKLIATVYIGDKKKILWKDDGFREDYNWLEKQFKDHELSILSSTRDENEWIITAGSDTDPGKVYYYNRKNNDLEFLYTPRPELPTEHLVPVEAVKYASADGLEIPAYLTVPEVENKSGLPAVIVPHGGPWARDYWGYNAHAQFLANRGYVVLQPNFRGSTGYGKEFLNAAINQWGEKMQDDLTAGARFLVQKGLADAGRIAIMGGSYGGYATLAGLTFTPEVYAAGISIVGPSNLFTLLETIPPYWETARIMFYRRMGDPTTEKGREQLTRQSPLFHADKIKAPLLVAQGANDPRVKKSESDQIVTAMRKHGLAVEYFNFPDEGHGFAVPENNMAFIAAMEKFLAKHLGGRYQEGVRNELQAILDNAIVKDL